MPAKLTRPSAQAACAGLKPTSTRYFVWCICTAYQAKRPEKIAQRRSTRSARSASHAASVQSTATQAGSTTFAGAPAGGDARLGVAVGLEPEILGTAPHQQIERRQHHAARGGRASSRRVRQPRARR